MSIEYRASKHPTTGAPGPEVDELTNADGSLTISPTTGNVVASLNVGNANTWTDNQKFNDDVNVTFGTGGDADVYYDGTSLFFDIRVVGTGDVILTGDLMPAADSTQSIGINLFRYLAVYTDNTFSLDYYAGSSLQIGLDHTGETTDGRTITYQSGIITDVS